MKKYASAYFYVIIGGKEKFIFYEFDKFEVYIAFARKIGGATGLNRIVKAR